MADQETNTGETGTEGLDDASKAAFIPAPAPSIAEEVGLPPRSTDGQIPDARSNATDIQQLLGRIKLPERKDFRASADVVPPLEPAPIREPEEVPAPPKEPKPRDIVSAVHTLKDDFQMAVQDQKVSLVQAAALQEEKRVRQAPTPTIQRSIQKKNTFRILLIVFALLAFGAVALGASILLIQDRANVAPSTFLVDGLLFSEQTIPLPIQNLGAAEIKRQLGAARSSSGLTLGAITRIAPVIEEILPDGSPTSREATTREFLAALETKAPDELVRALSDEFFFGFHTVDENAPLLIIPITSYERAFAGMLAWEKTINGDLAPIFAQVPSLVRQPDGLLVERTFSDSVMRNFDIRALKDDSGNTQLYYSFPTRTILIIAESPYSFTEILARLRADRRL